MFFAVVLGAAALLGVASSLMSRRNRPSVLDDDPERTPVERPTLLPANVPLVAVLRDAASNIELSGLRVADGLRDVARVIQVSATEPVSEGLRARVANVVDEHAGVLKRVGQRIREAS